MRLVEKADGFIQGFRPGVAERLGFGPKACHARNPRLVFGRMTGFGQSGPLAGFAGHDINYIALAGALAAIGRKGEKPDRPLIWSAITPAARFISTVGMLAGLLNARATGEGDVVDAAMVDGVASLMAMFCSLRAGGEVVARAAESISSIAARPSTIHMRRQTGFMSRWGPSSPNFSANWPRKSGYRRKMWRPSMTRPAWPALREKMTAIFLGRGRQEWVDSA